MDRPGATDPSTPEPVLDALRVRVDLSEAAQRALCDELLERFEPAALLRAARERLNELGGGDALAILRILELFGSRSDWDAVARTALERADLSQERAWAILAALEDAEVLAEYPELAARFSEMDEELDEARSIEALAVELEESPEEIWVLLHAIGEVEPEVMVLIVDGLAEREVGPGIAAFLRSLAFSLDRDVSWAALEALRRQGCEREDLVTTWLEIEANHFDAEARELAREILAGTELGGLEASEPGGGLARPPSERMVDGLVGEVDGRGIGRLGIVAREGRTWFAVGITCELGRGMQAVSGLAVPEEREAWEFLDEFLGTAKRVRVRGSWRLMGAFLFLSLRGANRVAPPALAYWVEKTIGLSFYRSLDEAPVERAEETGSPFVDSESVARMILDACPDWVDDSTLCRELAREAVERGRDPASDEAVLRLLLERGLIVELERLRGMLWWMASWWGHEGMLGLSAAAARAVLELDGAEPVTSHPYLAEYGRRSLRRASQVVGGGAVEIEDRSLDNEI
jgi:hypothetical protein